MTIYLEKGRHAFPQEGMCLMEAVAFIAGEDFTDRPECVSPVLAEFGRILNDFLSDDARQQLIPLIPKLVGTVNHEQDQQDGLRCAHWLAAHWSPTWLDLVPELESHATALRAIPAPKTWTDVEDWFAVIDAAEAAAWAAAQDATQDATQDAAWEAAWEAAWAVSANAAWEAAREAAWVAAWEAAWAASGNAARVTAWASAYAATRTTDAARAAARAAGGAVRTTTRDSLQPTALQLQQDSIVLFTELVEGRHK
jgi:hypothetical protein